MAIVINLLYLGVAFVISYFGIHSVANWAAQEPIRTLGRSIELIVHGASLLLILLIFFGITTEVWQVAVATSIWRFLAIIGLIWLLTIVLLIDRSLKEMKSYCRFASWEELRGFALDTNQDAGRRSQHEDSAIFDLFSEVESLPDDNLAVTLDGPARINALTVMLVYQGLRLFLVGLVMAAFFAALGYLAVPSHLADVWNLDELITAAGRPLAGASFYDLAWVRMAALLGAISSLYVVLHATYDPEERKGFFKDVDRAVRRRFAVRLAYLEFLKSHNSDSVGDAPKPIV